MAVTDVLPGTETLEIIVCHIIWKDVRCSTGVLGDRSWRFLLHWKGRVYAYIRHCVKKKKTETGTVYVYPNLYYSSSNYLHVY